MNNILIVSATLLAIVPTMFASCPVTSTRDKNRFRGFCEAQYSRSGSTCKMRVAYNKRCSFYIANRFKLNQHCKPCCEAWGQRTSSSTNCNEEQHVPHVPESLCSDKEKFFALKVPFKGESSRLLTVLCPVKDPGELCLHYINTYLKDTRSRIQCCTHHAYRGGTRELPHCSEVDLPEAFK